MLQWPLTRAGGGLLYRNAGADDYHLSFDSDDAVSASDITAGYKTLDQYTTLSFAGASTSASGFIDLAASTGVLKKDEATNSLVSATVNFSGYVTIETSYASDFSDSQTTLLTSNELVYIHGNYWRIKALTAATINSVDIVYGCATEKSRPTPIAPSGYSPNNNYAKLQTINGEVFFICDFTYSGNANQELADIGKLTVVCDMRNGQTDAVYLRQDVSYVKYTSATSFSAYFSLTRWYKYASTTYKNNLKGSNYDWYDVIVQIRYNDQTFIEQYLCNSKTVTTTTHLLADNLQMNIWSDGTSKQYIYFSIGKVINGFDAGTTSSLWEAEFYKSDDSFVLYFKAYRSEYQADDVNILKQAFTIKSDNGSHVYPTKVEKSRAGSSGDYRLKIYCYFKFEDLAASTTDTTVYIHLYFFGSPYNGSKAGDFKRSVWNSSGNTENGFTDTDNLFTYSGTNHNFTGQIKWNIAVIAISAK